ncbi:MAG: anaerobic ribonucleoside-triphosphate reductase activating protein [Lachnospiraceae bacterium]|nr:anaerobic ribonucleoside-triphosphate reductase activating protein [Lachnospiraceae bacterium]
MQIYGLMKTTLLDFPGKVASTVFLGGCNMRCPFCHNMDLVTGLDDIEPMPLSALMDHLNSRKGVIDGVCITGGEPTLQPDLRDLISMIKEMGFLVKLDSNGSKTAVLDDLLSHNLVDYIAIDVKASFNNYEKICGLTELDNSEKISSEIISNVSDTIKLLVNQDSTNYEFRTTVIREFHDRDEFDRIGEMLKGASNYYLQNFVSSQFVPRKDLHGFTAPELHETAERLSAFIKHVGVRGVD